MIKKIDFGAKMLYVIHNFRTYARLTAGLDGGTACYYQLTVGTLQLYKI